jgi:capsular polysaccharide export protein
MNQARSFLFLQGGTTPFFARLSDRLRSDGHAVFRINFNGGDRLYWGRRPAAGFRGTAAQLPGFYDETFCRHGVSDVIAYNDRRPVHAPALALARERGLRTHVFEEGYVRPYFITVERGGVNGNSALPREAEWYRHAGRKVPDGGHGTACPSNLYARAFHDIAYEVASLANPLLHPRYRTHVPYNRWVGYAAHLRRFAAWPFHARHDRALIARLAQDTAPTFLLPLQLESDAQIRHYSPFGTMSEVIERVMGSFACHAPADARLVIKNHPLDPGFVNFGRLVARLGGQMGVTGRVEYVDTGDASALMPRARGVITVNSTVGMSALTHGRPTIALGTAIYDLPGLTFQGTLDAFWRESRPPDAELFRSFRNVVIHATQVNGGYYTPRALALAVANSPRLLLAERSPLEELL